MAQAWSNIDRRKIGPFSPVPKGFFEGRPAGGLTIPIPAEETGITRATAAALGEIAGKGRDRRADLSLSEKSAYVHVGGAVGWAAGSPPEGTRVDRLFRPCRVLKCPRIVIARIAQGKSRMKVITGYPPPGGAAAPTEARRSPDGGGSSFSHQASDLTPELANLLSEFPKPRPLQHVPDLFDLLLGESGGHEAGLPRVLHPEGEQQKAACLQHAPDFLEIVPQRGPEVESVT